jgi:DNA repair protein RecN (Recombination protein N)
MRSRAEEIEENPERLAEVRDRLQTLRDLRRKYGDTLAEVVAFHEEVRARLAELEGYEQRVAELEADREQAVLDERAAAAAWQPPAGPVPGPSGRQCRHLQTGVPHAAWRSPSAIMIRATVSFLRGQPGLAVAAWRVRAVASWPFDVGTTVVVLTETGVRRGRCGDRWPRRWPSAPSWPSRAPHQVLVFYLAQVAARRPPCDGGQACRWRVTLATATPVSGDARVEEVARMMSGDQAAESARVHAADLLAQRPERSLP